MWSQRHWQGLWSLEWGKRKTQSQIIKKLLLAIQLFYRVSNCITLCSWFSKVIDVTGLTTHRKRKQKKNQFLGKNTAILFSSLYDYEVVQIMMLHLIKLMIIIIYSIELKQIFPKIPNWCLTLLLDIIVLKSVK